MKTCLYCVIYLNTKSEKKILIDGRIQTPPPPPLPKVPHAPDLISYFVKQLCPKCKHCVWTEHMVDKYLLMTMHLQSVVCKHAYRELNLTNPVYGIHLK